MKKYIKKLRKDCKKIIGEIEKEMYNNNKDLDFGKISQYAQNSYRAKDYDEVYTEYLVDKFFREAGWKW